MKRAVVLALLAACDAGEKKAAPAPSPAPAPAAAVPARPNVKVGNGMMTPLCTAEKLSARGIQRAPRVLDARGCSLLENPTEGGGEIWVMFALDTSSPAELARYVRCESLPPIDWQRDRVVVLGLQWSGPGVTMGRSFDDGTTQTLVLDVGDGEHVEDYKLTFAVVPRDRRSDFLVCPTKDFRPGGP